jgi:hypothetical protein
MFGNTSHSNQHRLGNITLPVVKDMFYLREGTRRLPPGVKRPGREADYSPSSTDEDKETWVYTSTVPYFFMAKSVIN